MNNDRSLIVLLLNDAYYHIMIVDAFFSYLSTNASTKITFIIINSHPFLRLNNANVYRKKMYNLDNHILIHSIYKKMK